MTLDELLSPFGIAGEDFLTDLAAVLSSGPARGSAALSSGGRAILDEFGGVDLPEVPLTQQVNRDHLAMATGNLVAQVRKSMQVDEAATMLGIDRASVRRRVAEHVLYGHKVGIQLRLPTWQFDGGAPIPGLGQVLSDLRPDLDPLEVEAFMEAPDPDLEFEDGVLPPRAWLLSGGDPAAVATLARQLGSTW